MKKEQRDSLLQQLQVELIKIHWTVNTVNKKFTDDELENLLDLIETLKDEENVTNEWLSVQS